MERHVLAAVVTAKHLLTRFSTLAALNPCTAKNRPSVHPSVRTQVLKASAKTLVWSSNLTPASNEEDDSYPQLVPEDSLERIQEGEEEEEHTPTSAVMKRTCEGTAIHKRSIELKAITGAIDIEHLFEPSERRLVGICGGLALLFFRGMIPHTASRLAAAPLSSEPSRRLPTPVTLR